MSQREGIAMIDTLVRASVAAVASIALLMAFVSTPEGFTQAKKPRRAVRAKSGKPVRGRDEFRSGTRPTARRQQETKT
jgi:hypothetical protein